MSLAYKLNKIGSVISEQEAKEMFRKKASFKKDADPNYLTLNFQIENNQISNVSLNEDAIEDGKFFFTKKIGGSGEGIYYLYPNFIIQEEKISKKNFSLIINTLKNGTSNFCLDKHKDIIDLILNTLKNTINDNSDEKNQELVELLKQIVQKEKGNYILCLTINGNTFYKLMPEIIENFVKNPVFKNKDARIGYDALTNKECEVGYRPEIKVFSYDNYHDSLNYRINFNLPLSFESARNIKLAWIYIQKNLTFNYNSLEYILLPEVLDDNIETLKTVLKHFASLNSEEARKERSCILEDLSSKEKKIIKELKKLQKNNQEEMKLKEEELNELKKQRSNLNQGFIQKQEQDIMGLGDLKDKIKLNYIFIELDMKNLAFKIQGSIEDVLPSKIRFIVQKMRERDPYISDKFPKYITKEQLKENVFLYDFFGRDEIFFTEKNSQKNNKNAILKERIYLARLLLTDEKISLKNLINRFLFNREYNYEKKKRLTDSKIKEWIEYSNSFKKKEERILQFLKDLNKIKERA